MDQAREQTGPLSRGFRQGVYRCYISLRQMWSHLFRRGRETVRMYILCLVCMLAQTCSLFSNRYAVPVTNHRKLSGVI